jgi:uncharacterized protein
MLELYFPVAEIEINPLLPIGVAFVISFFTSMGGVSGAFLILPFQVSVLGFSSPAVSATNQLFNIVAIPGGVYRYMKEGRMVWPLTGAVIIGTLPGVLVGAFIRCNYLPDPGSFKLFAGCVLLYIGGRLLKDLLSKHQANTGGGAEQKFRKAGADSYKDGDQATFAKNRFPTVMAKRLDLFRIGYAFDGQDFDISTLSIILLSLVVGVIGGVYGIGGGAIIAPFLVSFFGLPVYTIAGAALMGTFVTSVAGVLFYQAIAPLYPGLAVAPDWGLGILFGIGGAAGMYCGARAQKFIPAKMIKSILAGCILFVAVTYIVEFF